jgi:hypothetical protein
LCAPEVSVDVEPKAEIDDKFDPHIEKIMRALEDQEAVLTLPRTPTKGLPNQAFLAALSRLLQFLGV